MDKTFKEKLLATLAAVDRPTTFCVGEHMPMVLPGLEVDGVGPIAVPIVEQQAKELIRVCHQAPYGKGETTLVDTAVRRVWALDPKRLKLTNPHWKQTLSKAMKQVQAELGLESEKLDCHLHQLLLYEPGSFFLPHKDGEKLDGMVATLVIVLPSIYEGGELVVRHGGREETIDFSGPKNRFGLNVAAFYADCEHEIKPLRSGYRLTLVYNVTLAGKKRKAITAPRHDSQTAEVRDLLEAWKTKGSPARLAITLDHEYTKSGLTPDLLKGADRARAEALFGAAKDAGCRAYLALLTLYELGAADCDYEYSYGRSRRYNEPDEYSMGEIIETTLSADHWTDPDGNVVDLGEIPFLNAEVVSEAGLRTIDPEEEFEGYTGNAGMELERWYRHAAIVVWTEDRHFEILCDAGIESATSGLEQMVREWMEDQSNETLKSHCVSFANAILAKWLDHEHDGDYYCSKDRESKMPSILNDLNEPELVARYINDILVRDDSEIPGKWIAAFCRKDGWRRYHSQLTRLFEGITQDTITREVAVFDTLCASKDEDAHRHSLCTELGRLLVAALRRIDHQPDTDWRAKSVDRRAIGITLFKSFLTLGAAEEMRTLVNHIVGHPKLYDLTKVQVPVLLALAPSVRKASGEGRGAIIDWLVSANANLSRRTEKEPEPPPDWRRPADISCACNDCSELKRFLKDPKESTHRFRVRKDRRQHLHGIIERHNCDTTHVTEHFGSPHTLVCKKTRATYERQRKIYETDRKHLAEIKAMQANIDRGRKQTDKGGQ